MIFSVLSTYLVSLFLPGSILYNVMFDSLLLHISTTYMLTFTNKWCFI